MKDGGGVIAETAPDSIAFAGGLFIGAFRCREETLTLSQINPFLSEVAKKTGKIKLLYLFTGNIWGYKSNT